MFPNSQLQGLLQQANLGDVEAQLRLADHYESVAEGGLARYWMEKAAAGGNSFAAAQLGVWMILGHFGDMDVGRGFEHICAAANAGHAKSQLLAASLCAGRPGIEPNEAQAVAWLLAAARRGNATAQRQLGFMLPSDPATLASKRALLDAAARQGDDAAQYFLARVLNQSGTESDSAEAERWLAVAARRGNPCALRCFSGDLTEDIGPPASPEGDRSVDWALVAECARLPADEVAAEWDLLRDDPFIRSMPGFLDELLSDYVMLAARPHLKPATVNDAERGMEVQDASRTNNFMGFFLLEGDAVIQSLNRRIARASGTPVENGEVLGVLHYRPGQTYMSHHDYFDPDFPVHKQDMEAHGQRAWTFLVYLNEEFAGGETRFDELDLTFKGRRGEALLFRNVTETGDIEPLTRHTGLPPTSGEKWIISKWIRDRSQIS